MIFNKIETVCADKNISVRQMLMQIDMSINGYYAAKRNGDIKLSTLKKISDFLETPITDFLDVGTAGQVVTDAGVKYFPTNNDKLDAILHVVNENNALLKKLVTK